MIPTPGEECRIIFSFDGNICTTLEINAFHDLTEWAIYSARKKLRHTLPCSQRLRRPQW